MYHYSNPILQLSDMAAASSIPRYFSLSSPGSNDRRYTEYVHNDNDANGGLFIAQGDQFLSALSKLELVNAGNGLVHIRCCYNNKYLAIRSEDDHRVSAVANEPVEDRSSWSCTMFELTMGTPSGGFQRVRFTHVHLGRRIRHPLPDRVLEVAPPDFTGTLFNVHDISSFLALKLPQFVVFKADNNNYVRVVTDSGSSPHLTCGTAGDELHVNAMHEILPPADFLGSIRIRSLANNSCWRMHRDGPLGTPQEPWTLIIADSASNELDLSPNHRWTDGLYTAQKLPSNPDVNKISLTLVPATTPPAYLQRVPNNLLGYLGRNATALHPEAEFVVEEAVRSRKIYNVRYSTSAARLLSGHPSEVSSQTMFNETSSDQSFSRTFSYTESVTTSWNAQFSFSYGVSATLTASVPLFSSGSLTTSWEFTAAYEMGSERTTEQTREDTIDIVVKPWTTVSVTRWESLSSHDVPYSYTQEDILLTGVMRRLEKHDGIAIGVNNHDIFYRATEEPIGSSRSEPREYIIVPSSSRIVSSSNSAPVG